MTCLVKICFNTFRALYSLNRLYLALSCGVLRCLVLSKYELAIPARALLLLNSLYLALCCVSLVLVSCSGASWPILSGFIFFVLSCVLRYVLLEEKTRMYERTMDMKPFHVKV